MRVVRQLADQDVLRIDHRDHFADGRLETTSHPTGSITRQAELRDGPEAVRWTRCGREASRQRPCESPYDEERTRSREARCCVEKKTMSCSNRNLHAHPNWRPPPSPEHYFGVPVRGAKSEAELSSALDWALAQDGPTVVEAFIYAAAYSQTVYD